MILMTPADEMAASSSTERMAGGGAMDCSRGSCGCEQGLVLMSKVTEEDVDGGRAELGGTTVMIGR